MTKPQWLSLNEALQQLFNNGRAVGPASTIPTAQALGKVTAQPIIAPINVPQHNNSAMDGYAIRHENGSQGTHLHIVATVLAGDAELPVITDQQCARITTGAMIPPHCDAVVIQENVSVENNHITLNHNVSVNDNIRFAGSDICTGDIVIQKGHRLTAADLVMISSLGISEVVVTPTLTVGLLATGNELVEPGRPLMPGQIFESNRVGVGALLHPLSITLRQYGIIPDSPAAIESALLTASNDCDVIISTGGVSVGDADFIKDVLIKIGNIDFWKVAIKPGKPFAFGTIQNTLFCGLPGNPVSAFVTTEQLVVPLIRHLQGEQMTALPQRLTLRAKLATPLVRRAGRLDFQRAVFSQNDTGELVVTPLKTQSSGVMTSFAKANCYLLIPADVAKLNGNEWVDIQPFTNAQFFSE